MAAVMATCREFLEAVRHSGVLDSTRIDDLESQWKASNPTQSAKRFAKGLVRSYTLTEYQAKMLLTGRWRGLRIGKYRVLDQLGAGGCGTVYLCEHPLMRRNVAIKVLPSQFVDDPAMLERFYREARAAAALDHPNIVHAIDVDCDGDRHFFVMEYIDGDSFYEIVARDGPIDATLAVEYGVQVASALAHIHAAGLIHRDIKPANIILDRMGTVKLLDLGLARFFQRPDEDVSRKYDDHAILGTADYMAPEQAIDSSTVDGRADIYGLGATLYFLLAGRDPFAGVSITQKLLFAQTRKPDSLTTRRPELPLQLVEVVRRMMAKDPANRIGTAADVATALAPWTKTTRTADATFHPPAVISDLPERREHVIAEPISTIRSNMAQARTTEVAIEIVGAKTLRQTTRRPSLHNSGVRSRHVSRHPRRRGHRRDASLAIVIGVSALTAFAIAASFFLLKRATQPKADVVIAEVASVEPIKPTSLPSIPKQPAENNPIEKKPVEKKAVEKKAAEPARPERKSLPVAGTGWILREQWNGNFESLESLDSSPKLTSGQQLSRLEGPTDWSDQFASRMRGFLVPEKSGEYVFFVAADDQAEFWLSTNENPANKDRRAFVESSTAQREWGRFSTQRSMPIELIAGRKYYLELVHREHSGHDHVAVAWQSQGGEPKVIDGKYLSPWTGGAGTNLIANGGFEAGPGGWQLARNAEVIDTLDYRGGKAVHLPGNAEISLILPNLSADATYALSGWARLSKTGGKVVLGVRDGPYVTAIVNSTDFRCASLRFKVGADRRATVFVLNISRDDAWVDDLELVQE